MPPDLKAALDRAASLTEEAVAKALDGERGAVADAMSYAVVGGKCLRGFLVLESARVLGVDEAAAVPAAAAVECVHAYSLVHDDMPCMDDDALRRGQPTVHKAWDEGTALLVGDALQALAFELVATGPLPPDRRLSLSWSLARAAGLRGMVGGQADDIAAETASHALTLEDISALQRRKTGALIEWSAAAGAAMAGAESGPFETYGRALGLAFQIADDVLDVEGDAALVGKALRKDQGRGKATFVSLMGLDEAKARAEALVTEACDGLSGYGERAETLRQAARFVISRQN
ncbi:polyprenyl synthetase family protein [Cognatishimia sp. F0-27]|uniref:polyprenyl synthetase family protein n=1 Tax=Cognatishimia sp. F0-27 TaxID=2816855 RepID=UPI001D0C9CC3|nr:polyprenyl synthetase family protein [Cognatishimia sp. F0-27]MCC1492076.1 polyprenyl synthetase family protein [Cognatishimia sp. F0-27]